MEAILNIDLAINGFLVPQQSFQLCVKVCGIHCINISDFGGSLRL